MHPVQPPTERNRWGVILAGGDGVRLRPLTRQICGDERPKQFCRLLFGETLLDQTRRRIGLILAPERISIVVTRSHERYYAPLKNDASPHPLIVQPVNRGTSPAILYSLLRISAADPEGVVAFFPSDHYVSDDHRFMAQVRRAMDAACADPSRVVLLGIEPEAPEVEYGWIEPGASIELRQVPMLRKVRRFWEEPAYGVARDLFSRGCLWNSFVMAGTISGFLRLIRKAAPHLYARFDAINSTFDNSLKPAIVERLYRSLTTTNFSEQVLAPCAAELGLLPVTGVTWSDLGTPQRVFSSLTKHDIPENPFQLQASTVA